jgi:hypothetical protein
MTGIAARGRDGNGRPMRHSMARISAACALALCGCLLAPVAAPAEFQIEGSVDDLRVEAAQTPIEEIFSALSAVYGVTIAATVLPDQPVSGVYTGSLQRVVAQLLNRYDYVLAVSPEKIEISFLGLRGGQGALVRVAQTGRGLRAPLTRTQK